MFRFHTQVSRTKLASLHSVIEFSACWITCINCSIWCRCLSPSCNQVFNQPRLSHAGTSYVNCYALSNDPSKFGMALLYTDTMEAMPPAFCLGFAYGAGYSYSLVTNGNLCGETLQTCGGPSAGALYFYNQPTVVKAASSKLVATAGPIVAAISACKQYNY
jgi:hypothetical protein